MRGAAAGRWKNAVICNQFQQWGGKEARDAKDMMAGNFLRSEA